MLTKIAKLETLRAIGFPADVFAADVAPWISIGWRGGASDTVVGFALGPVACTRSVPKQPITMVQCVCIDPDRRSNEDQEYRRTSGE